VADAVVAQLPRGRHGLTREQVESDQRLRIVVGMAEAMRAKGYVGTPVADIIKRAGVSRETFYQLHRDKLASFLAAFDLVGEILLDRLNTSLDGPGEPIDRLARAVDTYLDSLASEPGFARLFLVEVHAAGPEAMARRTVIQGRIVDALVDLLDARSAAGRLTCQMLVAAVSAMVTGPLVADDLEALRALGPPILEHVRRLQAAGMFASSSAGPRLSTT
jgi:AcrR family transcriptional regulator